MSAPTGDTRDDRSVAAGEYVLGQLEGAEREAFERALASDAGLKQEVHWWEQRLALVGLRRKPVAPRPVVWLDIQQRIRSRVAPLRPARTAAATTVWASLATAASLLLGVALVIQLRQPDPAPQVVTQVVPTAAVSYVALLEVPKSNMKWSVSVTPDRQQIVVRATGDVPAAAKELDAELWLITDDGPVSLGVIPKVGEERRIYAARAGFASGKVLAVSLEPRGGSPTGQPTGPVVSTGAVLQAG